jgi:MFS family permease
VINPYRIFLLFAFPYLLSTALRSVNAVIAPDLVQEFALSSGQLGLLSSLYFLGFTATQLPLGTLLDRYGPRRVEPLMLLACLGGVALYASAQNFAMLCAGRLLTGIGVSACLMAPYTGFRHWFAPALRGRFSTWMLMTGSLGMVVSSAPVQFAVPLIGWRGVFWVAFALVAVAALCLWARAPEVTDAAPTDAPTDAMKAGYAQIFGSAYFKALTPYFIIVYGALLGVQTLWIGPWFTTVGGMTPREASWAVLGVHAAMGVSFLTWGLWLPRLTARGQTALSLVRRITPIALVAWAAVIGFGAHLGALGNALAWAFAFVCLSVAGQTQVTISQQFAPALAGRANTASNLLVFSGAFAVQALVGQWVDAFAARGLGATHSLQAALAVLWVLMAAAHAWLEWRSRVAALVKQR